jgi:SH3-like domain-containing protein
LKPAFATGHSIQLRCAGRWRGVALAAVLLACAQGAMAAEFRSVGEGGAVFYDAPSAAAKKLYRARRYYPVAIVVELEQWDKVRDVTGDLAWVEKRSLSTQRTVMVVGAWAQVRAAPEVSSPIVFAAEKDVALNVIEIANPGWVRVAHADGQSGFVQASEVWGL